MDERTDVLTDGKTDGRTKGRTDGQTQRQCTASKAIDAAARGVLCQARHTRMGQLVPSADRVDGQNLRPNSLAGDGITADRHSASRPSPVISFPVAILHARRSRYDRASYRRRIRPALAS